MRVTASDLRAGVAPCVPVLRFASGFNQPVHIPAGVSVVSFQSPFNSPVELPAGIFAASFGDTFDRDITLPDGILYVKFGAAFNRPVILPSSVLGVRFGATFRQSVRLPFGLQDFQLPAGWRGRVAFPPAIRRAIFHHSVGFILPAADRPGGMALSSDVAPIAHGACECARPPKRQRCCDTRRASSPAPVPFLTGEVSQVVP
ncbi:hypothetical protein JKP88DRAFT_241334 [Tribonema minus]|uniref:Uncharacterized protein n=1 Tax=Tribonema minus TaxID=303371 RepID=A0A835Z015_9STRA|nr:hypothetical protein JKP88DRAFT_241334 [Tribonema minus]